MPSRTVGRDRGAGYALTDVGRRGGVRSGSLSETLFYDPFPGSESESAGVYFGENGNYCYFRENGFEMTFWGVILIIVLALTFIGGVMEVCDLIGWSDLWKRPKKEQPDEKYTIQINIFSCFKEKKEK